MEMDELFKNYTDFTKLFESSKDKKDRIEEGERIIRKNIRYLTEKAKILDKPIPTTLLAVIYVNQPMGKWFFDEYKEWLE